MSAFDGLDVVVELVKGDPLESQHALALKTRLEQVLGENTSVVLGESTLEVHDLPWWLSVHLWCTSELAVSHAGELLRAASVWGREWRLQSPRKRPVHMTIRASDGVRIDALVVKSTVQRLGPQDRGPRPFPVLI